MAQVQCPNCGGYRVETETELIDRKSGQQIGFGCGFWFFLVFFAIAPLIVGTIGLLDSPPESPATEAPGLICIGLLFTIAALLYIRSYFKANKIEQYYHTCWLCGYKWSRRADEPLPLVTIRSDLIAKGEQRLQEEQEARDAAAAAQWIQQAAEEKVRTEITTANTPLTTAHARLPDTDD